MSCGWKDINNQRADSDGKQAEPAKDSRKQARYPTAQAGVQPTELISRTVEKGEAMHTREQVREINAGAASFAVPRTCGTGFYVGGERISLGAWEYLPETDVFFLDDGFYAIYATNVGREGCFMKPEVYIREFVHPDDAFLVAVQVRKTLESVVRYFSGELEHRIVRRDGQVCNIRVRCHVVRDAAGKINKCYGANQDITGEKELEKALHTSREKLSLAAELACIGPWEYHPDRNLFEFNDEFYAVYGTDMAREGRFMSPEDYVREFMHPEDAWMMQREISQIHAARGTYTNRLQHRIIRRDGAVRTIMVHDKIIRDEDGKIVRWFGANQDITEQVQTEAALRESEQRHRATLNALPDMLFRVDMEGRLLDYRIPDRYWPWFGEVKGPYRLLGEILPVPLAGQAKEMIILTVGTGETRVTEYCGPVNGRECFLQIRTAAINNKEALVIIQNQTELYRARRECQRLERLNLVGAMAAGIGHEVRNPLTTVRGYLQFLSGKEKFRDCAEMFNLMIGELDRTNAIISEFLALSKNKAVKLEPRNLNTIIRAIYPLLAVDALEANKSINLELQEDIPLLDLDEGEIRQLIINFVRNSLEATADKGQVRIKTRGRGQDVLLIVQDNGTGIPASVIEQIGTPFVSTKDHGTGLGLSVCYSIAARHRATIDFQTSEQGTVFLVCFPRARDC